MRTILLSLSLAGVLHALPALASQVPCMHWAEEYPDGGRWIPTDPDAGIPPDVSLVCTDPPYHEPTGGCSAGGMALLPAFGLLALWGLRRRRAER